MHIPSQPEQTMIHRKRTAPFQQRSLRTLSIGCAVMMLWFSPVLAQKAEAKTVNLSVAASMTNAFNDIIAAFRAANPGVKLQANYASSGSLAKQIDQGAPADIYVSANPKWMKFLVGKGLIAAGTDRIFACNSLVFVGMEGTASSLDGIASLKRIAIGTPASVPAGQYARQALENKGLYTLLERENRLVMAKDVRQALIYADRGEVDGAFVYKTDALLATRAKILFMVPEDLYDRVSYPLGLTVSGSRNRGARGFYDFLAGDEAAAIFKKYGFETAP
jgi:molybdate transport system substrate-binding protein